MATPGTRPQATLQIKRTFRASREKVFQAWTDPKHLKHWSAPSDEYDVIAEVDLRVGGRYRIQMKHPNGGHHVAVGEYREVEAPEKLVYTWSWEDGFVENTLVTVEFNDRGGETEVVLTHDLFPDAETRDKHTQGWNGCLVRLEKLLQS